MENNKMSQQINDYKNEMETLKKRYSFEAFYQLINGVLWYDEGQFTLEDLWDFIQERSHSFPEVSSEDQKTLLKSFGGGWKYEDSEIDEFLEELDANN